MLMATALLLAATVPVASQGIPFSQHGSVSQRIGYTTIRLEYNRPIARGRTLFGGLVPWDRIWHPGADSATTISLDRDITVQGQRLPAGRYSLWTVPGDSVWTVIFSAQADAFHTPYPGASSDALRVTAFPDSASHMETMAFYFPVVHRDSAVLAFHWGTTVVPLRITVDNGEDN